jgi:hypothetical protein
MTELRIVNALLQLRLLLTEFSWGFYTPPFMMSPVITLRFNFSKPPNLSYSLQASILRDIERIVQNN